MKTLFLNLIDPSGHRRTIKLTEFPVTLGTDLTEKYQLRDHGLESEAFRIEQKSDDEFVLKAIQKDLFFKCGDLKLTSLEIPFQIPMRIHQTELVFSTEELRETAINFPKGEQAWYTESPAGIQLLNSIRKSSLTRLSIYLTGETGTGKEVLAKIMHLWSERSSAAFVPINCGALALSLAESELFGHVKGSFTGATRDRPGALLQAHGGTLFLDEVGDLPLELQVKLLRFLENGEIRPVGSDRTLFADVRIICATHKPLLKLVKEGKFRQDLYFRLASIPIEIPSLRSRPDDIRALASIFAKGHGKTLTRESVNKLQVHLWPGNVRELRHAVERACGLAGPFESILHSKDFDFLMNQQTGSDGNEEVLSAGELALPGVATLREMEKVLILRSLKIARGNRTDAAKILGIARSTLFEMMKRHRIVGPKTTDIWAESLMFQ
jgi:two-component system response regulator HydG